MPNMCMMVGAAIGLSVHYPIAYKLGKIKMMQIALLVLLVGNVVFAIEILERMILIGRCL